MKLANIAGGDCSYTVFKTTVQVTIFPLKLCFVVDFIVNCNNKNNITVIIFQMWTKVERFKSFPA